MWLCLERQQTFPEGTVAVPEQEPWMLATAAVERYRSHPAKAELILRETVPPGPGFRTVQALFYEWVRHRRRIDWALDHALRRRTKEKLRSFLDVAAAALLSSPERDAPKVVHHAVKLARRHFSAPEGRFVNAVLRNSIDRLFRPVVPKGDETARLSVVYSHPEWLVERWLEAWGAERTEALLQWDQKVPPILLRTHQQPSQWPEGLTESDHTGFARWTGEGDWGAVVKWIRAGHGYAQDPSTVIPVRLLQPKAGETFLDLCASPGGKSRQLTTFVQEPGCLVSVDLPDRLKPLQENLGDAANVHVLGADITELTAEEFKAKGLPPQFDAVVLDAPCSNSGVLRRRPDAKWRLEPADFARMAKLQGTLLRKAAEFVKPGGRMVYSTCSIDPEENEAVVRAFLKAHANWTLEAQELSFPTEKNHDGGAAFRLVHSR